MTKVLDIVKGFEKASTPEYHKPGRPSFHNLRDVKKTEGENNLSILDRAEIFDSVTDAALTQSTIYKIDKIGNELFSVKKVNDDEKSDDVSSCDDFRKKLYPDPMDFYRICFDQESTGDEYIEDEWL
ncbi:hypothetical protein [Endozoicomonas elysicola]|uniref:Uncharacterized protein n=1 Tax=Endozoicomonas elysicola TaxID=305900 RepID=A0A081KAK9_9GAMM|nr:hypothetical protein [Endozoicomonas elysicola]KEI71185.1 hypothetical protein GV64_10915 [Endozoicomonas elysicola]